MDPLEGTSDLHEMDDHEGSNNDIADGGYVYGAPGSSARTLEGKILHAKKRIGEEQQRRDTNVEEYLKMAAVAQRSQLPQVKQLFEKKNTKAATRITALQRKLDRYERELNALKESSKFSSEISTSRQPKPGVGGISISSPKAKGYDVQGGHHHQGSEASESSNTSSHRGNKSRMQNVSQGLRSVSGNLKDGLTGISGTVIGKPREIASYLMKQKFGSADNIPSRVSEECSGAVHHGSERIAASRENVESIGGINAANQSGYDRQERQERDRQGQDDGITSECSVSVKSSSDKDHEIKRMPQRVLMADAAELAGQIKDVQEELASLRDEFDNFKTQTVNDVAFVCQGLQEERFRSERLEEQINDLTELHQAETSNLKQALADTEEKLSYQSEERLRDLAELLDACQVKISRLEQQQAQLVTIEGLENSGARALAVKLVNIGLTMLQLLLLLVATIVSTVTPFVGSRIRVFLSVLIVMIFFFAHRKWPSLYEETLQTCSDFINRL